MDEQMTSTFAIALRDRVSTALLDLEQRGLLTRKAVQYATGYEVSQVRRIFIGEQQLSLTGYAAMLRDRDICNAAKIVLRDAVDPDTEVTPERLVDAPESATDMVCKAAKAFRAVNSALRDGRITLDEAAGINTELAELDAEAQQLHATVNQGLDKSNRGPRAAAG
jgi:hypothetical protein